MIEISELLKLSIEFQRVTGVSDTTVSSRLFKDSKKLTALKNGSDITVSRFNDAIRYFSENWPYGAVWPPEIARPESEAVK